MITIELERAVRQIVGATRRFTAQNASGFPFFLIVGAGISHPSIPLAAGIERLCREEIARQGIGPPPPEGGSALERYQACFEMAFPQAEDRQSFLSGLIRRAPVSAANFRLAHLLGERDASGRLLLTNLIFTPNFDEMLTRSLRLFGRDVAVCDHPKTTQRIRPGRTDLLQVVHVHGTHWFYDCCNLRGEIARRAKAKQTDIFSMAQLLDRVLADRSPLVAGYSGWEGDVIMTALRRRLRQPTLPYNLYWFCFRRSEAADLPDWLRDHASVRLVLATQPDEAAGAGAERAATRSPLSPLSDERRGDPSGTSPGLPARLVFEALIQELNLPAPRLTSDPLEFFAEQLRETLSLKEDDGAHDLYLIRDVLSRVEAGARLEREHRQATTAAEKLTVEALARVIDALRRSAYTEALREAQQVDLGSLSPQQYESFEAALENLYLGTADVAPDIGLAACELRLQLAETALAQGGTDTAAYSSWATKATIGKGYCLANLGRLEEAISAYDDVVQRLGDGRDPAGRGSVIITTLVNKGIALAALKQTDAAASCYDEVIQRFGDDSEPAISGQVAKALFNKGVVLDDAGRTEAAIPCYDEVIRRFGDAAEPALRELVALALVNRGVAHADLGKIETAVASYEEVIRRFGDAVEPALREAVAWALYDQGEALAADSQVESAVGSYDEVIRRFGDAGEPGLREMVACTLLDKGGALARAGRVDGAVASLDELIRRFGGASEPALSRQVEAAQALRKSLLSPPDEGAGSPPS